MTNIFDYEPDSLVLENVLTVQQENEGKSIRAIVVFKDMLEISLANPDDYPKGIHPLLIFTPEQFEELYTFYKKVAKVAKVSKDE